MAPDVTLDSSQAIVTAVCRRKFDDFEDDDDEYLYGSLGIVSMVPQDSFKWEVLGSNPSRSEKGVCGESEGFPSEVSSWGGCGGS
ncbi:hypothetical protein R6Q59_029875 [Mikania micrantha]